jgi:SAM-dependent methyltransferase
MRGLDVNLKETLPLLRCPRSHTSLSQVGEKLVSASGDEYPIVNGKPVLVRQILDWHVSPPREDKISKNITFFTPPERIKAADARILHLGSGNVPSEDPRVISLDVLPCANVDLVGEAEELPFQDNSLDYVESGAVFEHLHDPWKAIAEVKRVLKPGGQFRIDTAFMQGYHGFPGHYYNMTPQAIETHLVGDFNLRDSFVPNSATPLMTIEMIITRYLGCVSRELRERLESMPLREFVRAMQEDLTLKSPLLTDFDEYTLRCLAASFVVKAEKPKDYETRLRRIEDEGRAATDDWRALVREYYTARVELMQRHHEISLYRRWSIERAHDDSTIPDPPDIHGLLKDLAPPDMLDAHCIQKALEAFRKSESELKDLRDRWIYHYLREDPPAPEIQPEEPKSEAETCQETIPPVVREDSAHATGSTSSPRFRNWLRRIVSKSG